MNSLHSPIVVLGAQGQLGLALLKELGPRGLGISRAEGDLDDPATVIRHIEKLAPAAVINAAAYTRVDRAETEPKMASALNAQAPAELVALCGKLGVGFLHFSTDYVFDGSGTKPWTEEQTPGPINAYGRSKLEGERMIRAEGGRSWIVRSSWVHSPQGTNFVRTMLSLGCERTDLKVVNDQVGGPTYAAHLARASIKLLDGAPPGTYHLANSGEVSWHGFAEAIFSRARALAPAEIRARLRVERVTGIPSAEYPTPAKRPHNSRLDTSKARGLGITLPTWQEGLDECLEKIFEGGLP